MDESQIWECGVTIRRIPTSEKCVALTFDDGPDDTFTPAVMDILDSYCIPATFFCVGSQVQKNPDVLRRMVQAGYTVGNHTWSHPYLTKQTTEELIYQIESTSDLIEHVTGLRPTLFRPPYGDIDSNVERQIHYLGYDIILWNISSEDWSGIPGPQIAANVLPFIEPGAIVLHHSAFNVAGTIAALPYVIEVTSRMGYRFVGLSNLAFTLR